jgi:dTDP-4-amino-4,6-dideoxygalactose transaminase
MPGAEHVFHLYVVRTRRRDALAEHLRRRGVSIIIHYPVPIHLQRAYAGTRGWRRGVFPLTERLCSEILSLPIYPDITARQIAFVADSVRSFFAGSARRGSSAPRARRRG